MRIILLKKQTYVLVERVKVLVSLEKLKMTAIYLEKAKLVILIGLDVAFLQLYLSSRAEFEIEIINLWNFKLIQSC